MNLIPKTPKTYSEFVFVVDVSFLESFRQEPLGAVGAREDQVVVGGVSLGEVSPDVSHGTPTLLKSKFLFVLIFNALKRMTGFLRN